MKQVILNKITIIWLLLALLVVTIFIKNYFVLEANDDNGAEMVLAKTLSESNQVLSEDWVYSTEIRVVNTQLVYGLLFKFVDDWQDVRIMGNLIMYSLLALSVIYLCY